MKRHFVILLVAFILTGLLGFASLSLAQELILKGGKWEKKADMPTPRSEACAVTANGLIYVFGGRDTIKQVRLATVEVYNPTTDTWAKKADMPNTREQFVAGEVGGKIYLLGGFSTVARGNRKIQKTLTAIDVYNPATDAWEQKANAPAGRARMAGVAANGKIYVIGGTTNVGGGQTDLAIYDPATDKWEKGPDLIERRWSASAGAVNGKIYAIGGFRKQVHWDEIVEEYDPATNQWTRKQDLPTPRHEVSPFAPTVGGKIYMIGGNIDNGVSPAVEAYDPATDTWAAAKKLPAPAMGISATAAKGKIYVFGGVPNFGAAHHGGNIADFAAEKVTSDVLEYTPEGQGNRI